MSTSNFIHFAPAIFRGLLLGAFLFGISACQAIPGRTPGSLVTSTPTSSPTRASTDIAPFRPTSQPAPTGTPAPNLLIASPTPTSERLTLVDQKVVVLAENLSKEIARGFSRPTAAWIEKDGSILIVDENARSLSRLQPDGRLEKLLQNLPTPDDVIEDISGHIFVNTLTDGAIHVISVDGSHNSILVSHLSSPQGLIFDSDGNLVVTDSGNGRLLKIMIH